VADLDAGPRSEKATGMLATVAATVTVTDVVVAAAVVVRGGGAMVLHSSRLQRLLRRATNQ
jgi:hypothetical protein